MPRFVILEHRLPSSQASSLHWDLMLEHQGVLRTWALTEPPQTGRMITADALPDHRLAYLDYEGPVSGDRGTVTKWDQGVYSILRESDDRIELHLSGQQLESDCMLERGAGRTSWTFTAGVIS